MDEPNDNSSQATLGNAAIPEWMLKRRARLQLQKPQTRNSDDSPDATDSESASNTESPLAIEPVNTVQPGAIATSASRSDINPVDGVPDLTLDGVSAPDTELEPPQSAEDLPFPEVVIPPEVIPAKSKARPGKKVAAAPVIKVTTAPEPELAWHEILRQRWLGKDVLGGYAVSLGAHLVVAILLSLVVLHQQNTNAGSGLNTLLVGGGDAGGSGESIDGSSVLDIPPATGVVEEQVDTLLSANAVSAALGPSAVSLPGELGGLRIGSGGGTGNGDGKGVGDGIGDGLDIGGFKMPEGGKAVQKGSFTAWTVPEDPEPWEDYKIIIHVQYKNPKQKISPDDISGSIVDTDKWQMTISRHTAQIIPDANQIVINVPGARKGVRDLIRIRSARLRENQKLELVF